MKELFIEPLPKFLSEEDILKIATGTTFDIMRILLKRMEQLENRISEVMDFINNLNAEGK